MKEPLVERGAPQGVTGYTFDCLESVLAHPDVAPQTASLDSTPQVLDSIAELGRASLTEGNLLEFDQWRSYAFGYASEVATRSPLAVTGLRAPLAKLLFYGSSVGDVSASDMLHRMLTHAPVGPLEAVVTACATLDVPPQVWINRYGVSPVHQAELTLAYHGSRQETATRSHLTASQTKLPWSETSTSTIDTLAEGYVLDRGHALMEVATPTQKQHLFARLQHALEANDEPISMETHLNFERFVLRALVDSSLSEDAKNWLIDELVAQLSQVHDLGNETLEKQFDAYTESPSKLILDVADLHQEVTPSSRAHSARDEILAYATQAAIGNGKAHVARTIIPEIHDNADWTAAIMQYFDAFGPTKDLKPGDLITKLEPHRKSQYNALFSLAAHDPAAAKAALRRVLKQTDPEAIASFLISSTHRLSEQNPTMAIDIAARTLSLTRASAHSTLQTAMQNMLAQCGAEHAEGHFAHYLKRAQRHIGKYALLSFIAKHRVAVTNAAIAK